MPFFKDLTLGAFTAGFVAVLVGFTSSVAIVFQAAQAFNATPAQIGAAAVKAARAGSRIGATAPATKHPLSRGRRAVRTLPKRAQAKR